MAESMSVRRMGRYAMYRELASGGMATVHLGRLLGSVGFARTVAIKTLHPHLAKNPDFATMFLDEARLAARIQHPNVVSTLDVVELDGEVFIVMEYIHGETLARLLRSGEKVPVPIATAIVSGVLLGLHAAHEAKSERGETLDIVHRDVSPQNVLVGVDGVARVLDFGVAKATERLMQTTREGQVKGKLGYMPPEQVRGGHVNRQSDVYAASVVLWELLTGARLFDGGNDGAVLDKVLYAEVDPPSKHVPGLPPALDAIVLRGLARERSQRFSTAREMALALHACDPANPTTVSEWVSAEADDALSERAEWIARIESDAHELDALPLPSPAVPARSERRKLGRVVGGAGAVALALVAFTGVRAVRATQHTDPATTAPLASAPPVASDGQPAAEPAIMVSSQRSPAAPWRPSLSATKSECNPPYVLSPTGRKTYKRNCL
jgi:serine/threonine-protein kinase